MKKFVDFFSSITFQCDFILTQYHKDDFSIKFYSRVAHRKLEYRSEKVREILVSVTRCDACSDSVDFTFGTNINIPNKIETFKISTMFRSKSVICDIVIRVTETFWRLDRILKLGNQRFAWKEIATSCAARYGCLSLPVGGMWHFLSYMTSYLRHTFYHAFSAGNGTCLLLSVCTCPLLVCALLLVNIQDHQYLSFQLKVVITMKWNKTVNFCNVFM